MNAMLQAACAYADLGYPVFPCVPGEKRPLTADGFKSATTDPEQLERWWTATPTANIGLATEGLLVVDVDGPDNPFPGDERAAEFAGGPTAVTPRGGHHYFFRQPDGASLRCSTSKIAEDVDTRSDGGYVLVAPSVVDGKAYKWAEGLELEDPVESLPVAPAWFVAALAKTAAAPVLAGSGDAIPNGCRNSTLISIGGTLRRNGHSEPEILATLEAVNAGRCVPPLESAEVRTIARSAAGYEPDQAATAAAEDHAGRGVGGALANGGRRGKSGQSQKGAILASLDSFGIETVTWLWRGRIPRGMLTVFSGDPSTGKSTLTADLASRVTTGREWPDGASGCDPGEVIMLVGEDGLADTLARRVEAAGGDRRKIHILRGIGNPKTDDPHQPLDGFELAKHIGHLKQALIDLSQVRLVIIDPLDVFMGDGVDTHKKADVQTILAELSRTVEKPGVAVVGVLHLRKSSQDRALYRTSGSVAFMSSPRAAWSISKDNQNPDRRLMLCLKMNIGKEPSGLAFTIEDQDGIGIVNWESDPVTISADDALGYRPSKPSKARGPKGPTIASRAQEFLREALANGPVPAAEILETMFENGFKRNAAHLAKEAIGAESRKLADKSWVWAMKPESPEEPGNET
jgi:Bifunctional DNA primase/polymerase, N-terminal/AAA domain/Primase C terminal 1 (PriCT-1)